ncbi:hypothetical protein ACFXJO_19200 [Streptomyces lavendulae]|uniref:hypothetical protein n=1 Tax=Streptomyces TaxID=1883 RepID=UPI0024740115|nr:hypothetical protein [Streptomyces sp. SPB4]MDH6541363.1 hypothetical protein [Streptomyces sp. SPB4]
MRGKDKPRSSPLVPDGVRDELARQDWASVTCGCGRSAEHLEDALWDAAEGHPAAYHALQGHVFTGTRLWPPAPAACAVLMAVWSAGPPRLTTREALLWTLLSLLSAEDDGDDYGAGLYGQVAAHVRTGLPLLVGVLETGPGSVSGAYAEGILELLVLSA